MAKSDATTGIKGKVKKAAKAKGSKPAASAPVENQPWPEVKPLVPPLLRPEAASPASDFQPKAEPASSKKKTIVAPKKAAPEVKAKAPSPKAKSAPAPVPALQPIESKMISPKLAATVKKAKGKGPLGKSATPSAEILATVSDFPAPPEEKAAPKSSAKPKAKAAAPKATTAKPASSKKDALKVLFVTSECVPFAKTGGLGDAVAGLSKALHRLGHEVRIVMPLYSAVDYTKHGLTFHGSACIHMGHGEENWVGIHKGKLDGEVEIWFVDHGRYYHRPGLYSDGPNDYNDNAYRYGLLCKAAMQFCKDLNFIPDVMHLHDWPAAPAAAFLKTWDAFASPLSGTASVLTIHNIGHQGKYHAGVMGYYGLGNEHFTSDKFEDFGGVNLLKAGVHFADAITTVSPTHAQEILQPIGGQGLEGRLRDRGADVSGILNGVDYEHWSPVTDKFLPENYSVTNLKGKAACKAALQARFGLEVRPEVPLFGIVSRFAQQKGFDLLTGALPRVLNGMNMQLVVLGTGDVHTEGFFNWLHSIYPQRAGVYIGFSNELSHLIEAGSDFFLMPSLYEPCGLNQIYSLAYGTLPVVRATGGLADTVEKYNEATGDGTGFMFDLPTAEALHDVIGWAVSTWYDRPHHYKKMQQSAMKQEFPWSDSARQYVEVYKKAIAKKKAA